MASEHSTTSAATSTLTAPDEPMLICITGTRGSGKSKVGRILKDQGVPVIDADKLGHMFLDGPCDAYHAVLDRFGHDLVASEDGPINRAKLSEIIEGDAQAKCDLEAILHPPLFQLLIEKLAALADEPIIGIEMPLVHEVGKAELFDAVWCVIATEDVLIPRLMKRNGITEERARHQLSMQMSQSEKAEKSDVRINNSGSEEDLERLVLEHLAEARRKAGLPAESDAPEPEDVEGDDTPADTGSDEPPEGDDTPADTGVDEPPEGDDTPADTGSGEPSDEPKDEDDTDSNPPGDCDPSNANEHYLARLKQFAVIGTDAALERMGNVDTTGHKHARATMSMTVGSDGSDGETDPARELEVSVDMHIRNADTGDGEGCKCGCGDECRVSCACAPDCGCGCEKPTPCPDPNPTCPRPKRWDRNTVLVVLGAVLIAFFALLAFLFAMGNDTKTHDDHSHTVKIEPEVVKVEVVHTHLPHKHDPDSDKKPPVVIVPEPPGDGGDVVAKPDNPCPAGVFREVPEMPGYAFNYTLSTVKPRVATWYEMRRSDCRGFVVEGREADGRIAVHQVYDSNSWLETQLIFSYLKGRAIQIDRRDSRDNIFVGRAILYLDQNGYVQRSELQDSLQRRVTATTISLNASGHVDSITITRFSDVTGRELGTETISNASEAYGYLIEHFYGYDWFDRK